MVLWRPLTARPLRLAGLRAAYTFAAFGKKEYWGGGFERGQESTNNITSLLITAASLATGILWSHSAAADGALAVGLPSDVAKGGFASGYSYNAKTTDDARATAMDYCHKAPTTRTRDHSAR